MERMKNALSLHAKGYNCCQSVLAAFSDRFDISEEAALRIAAGFGGGAGTGELCGAITGGIMALDLIAAGDAANDPQGGKRRAAARGKALQSGFSEQFGALRCRELLQNKKEEPSEAVRALGVKNHCEVMIASAVELVEKLLKEEEA